MSPCDTEVPCLGERVSLYENGFAGIMASVVRVLLLCVHSAMFLHGIDALTCRTNMTTTGDFWDGPLGFNGNNMASLRNILARTGAQLMTSVQIGGPAQLDIAAVYAIFEAALRQGGARGLLDLLDMRFYSADLVQDALARAGEETMVSTYEPHLGHAVELIDARFNKKWTVPHHASNVKCGFICPSGVFHLPGGLWWLRHWAGEFLVLQARKAGVTSDDLVQFVIEQQTCPNADFVTVGVLHSVVWSSVVLERLEAPLAPLEPYLLMERYCYAGGHRTDSMHMAYMTGVNQTMSKPGSSSAKPFISRVGIDPHKECCHAVGHSVFYATAMRVQAQENITGLESFLSPHGFTIRPRSFRLPNFAMREAIHACQVSSNPSSFNRTDFHLHMCIDGLQHSYFILSEKPDKEISGQLHRAGGVKPF